MLSKGDRMREDTMLVTELLPKVQALPRADKLRLMQFLVFDRAYLYPRRDCSIQAQPLTCCLMRLADS